MTTASRGMTRRSDSRALRLGRSAD